MATRWSLCNVSLSTNHRRLPINCSVVGHSARCGAAIRSLSKRRSSACSSCCAPRRTSESSYAGVRVVSRWFASLESPYQQRIIDGRSIDSIEIEASPGGDQRPRREKRRKMQLLCNTAGRQRSKSPGSPGLRRAAACQLASAASAADFRNSRNGADKLPHLSTETSAICL